MMFSIHKLMARFVRNRRFLALVVLLLTFPLLTSCKDTGLAELAAEMALEWAQEKQLIKTGDDGSIRPDYVQIGAYELQRWMIGTTGDRRLDAALDVGPIAHSIRKADALAEEGMAQGDPAKLDEAIALRPYDWSYHDQKAAILAAQGNVEAARQSMQQSEAVVAGRIMAGGNCRGLHQNMLRNRENALLRQLQNDPDNPDLLEMLMDTHDAQHQLQSNGPESPCP
jgi:Flp pilus assembly protein TadD